MVRIDTVLVKLASRCNLDCGYCYVYHMGDGTWRGQPKRMSVETLEAVGRGAAGLALAQGSPLSIVFHGGEPLLVGPDGFDRACTVLRSHVGREVGMHLQTNGLLLSDAVLDACERHDVGVSVSLDGPARVHDRHRTTRAGAGSHSRVVAGIERLRRHRASARLFSGLLAVVDVGSDPAEVYGFLKSTGTPSVDFLCRDGNHDVLPPGKARVDSTEYGEWMAGLLDVYLADADPIRVRFLDDMLRLLLGGRAVKEGLGAEDFGILVVDTDGTVTKNDTLKSTAAGDRLAGQWRVGEGLDALVASPQFEAYHRLQRPSAPQCLACPHLRVCGGGMPAHRWGAGNAFDNPSVFCADQRLLIARMLTALGARAAA